MATGKIYGSQSLSQAFNGYWTEIRNEIFALSNENIMSLNLEDWKAYFVNKYDFQELEVFESEIKIESIGKSQTKRGKQFGRDVHITLHKFKLTLPFTGFSYLFWLRPSQGLNYQPTVEILNEDSGNITAYFESTENKQVFEREKGNLIRGITHNIPFINEELKDFKSQIPKNIETYYHEKLTKVKSENSFYKDIGIKINKDSEVIFNAPVIKKKSIPKPIFPSKGKKITTVPTFSEELYTHMINVINFVYKSVEKKPTIFLGKDEEALRDYILPTLETQFERTTATGETLNKNGKSDILVRYEDGSNLFIAECKVWTGKKAFLEAIDQLFGYLTWRDSKCAVILFVRNKNFSNVLKTIKETTVKHSCFLREIGSNGESSFSYLFHFPGDEDKKVYLEVMAFHFPE